MLSVKTPVETKITLGKKRSSKGVSRALEHERIAGTNVSLGIRHFRTSQKGVGNNKIMETFSSEALNSFRQDPHQSVRWIALQINLGITAAHKILTGSLKMNVNARAWYNRRYKDEKRVIIIVMWRVEPVYRQMTLFLQAGAPGTLIPWRFIKPHWLGLTFTNRGPVVQN